MSTPPAPTDSTSKPAPAANKPPSALPNAWNLPTTHAAPSSLRQRQAEAAQAAALSSAAEKAQAFKDPSKGQHVNSGLHSALKAHDDVDPTDGISLELKKATLGKSNDNVSSSSIASKRHPQHQPTIRTQNLNPGSQPYPPFQQSYRPFVPQPYNNPNQQRHSQSSPLNQHQHRHSFPNAYAQEYVFYPNSPTTAPSSAPSADPAYASIPQSPYNPYAQPASQVSYDQYLASASIGGGTQNGFGGASNGLPKGSAAPFKPRGMGSGGISPGGRSYTPQESISGGGGPRSPYWPSSPGGGGFGGPDGKDAASTRSPQFPPSPSSTPYHPYQQSNIYSHSPLQSPMLPSFSPLSGPGSPIANGHGYSMLPLSPASFTQVQQQQFYPPRPYYPSPRGGRGGGVSRHSFGGPMRGGRGGRFGAGGYRAGSFSSFGGGRDEQMGMGMEMGPTVPRSPLLEEFRNNRQDRKWEITDLADHIVEFSSDQHGSRFIQQKIETATEEERALVFKEIFENPFAIQTDVFGNYVIQKLFEFGTQQQKNDLAKTMEGNVLKLSLQTYGCRAIQKALEHVQDDQRAVLVGELQDNILECVKSSNANHVIQRIVALPPSESEPSNGLDFVSAFKGHVFELSTHPYGCRVLQRCFEFLPESQTRPLLDEMHQFVHNLVLDSFGNYVVQFVLERGAPEDRQKIIDKLQGQILHMARHKFASNVCEKALITSSPSTRALLIEEILTPIPAPVTPNAPLSSSPSSPSNASPTNPIAEPSRPSTTLPPPPSPISILLKDSFGNYLLQTALKTAEGEQRERLVNEVRPVLIQMRKFSASAYSKHLVAIERLVSDFPLVPTTYHPNAESSDSCATSTSTGPSSSVPTPGARSTVADSQELPSKGTDDDAEGGEGEDEVEVVTSA